MKLEPASRRRAPRVAALALLLFAQGPLARAHDIWLHADRFSLVVGETLIVRQLVGEELDVDLAGSEATSELEVLRDMTPRFELITARGSIDLLAELPDARTRPEVKPVLSRKMESAGLALVIMDHDVLYTDHTDAEFLEYLRHESLDAETYRPHMAADGFQDEGYQRSLKALVKVGVAEGEGDGELPGQVTGQALELLLLANPYALDPGDALDVRVLLHGEALPGARVEAVNAKAGASVATQTARADARGVARLSLDRPGLWLVRTVHLAPCSERSRVDCADTEWESYWTAYSFEVD